MSWWNKQRGAIAGGKGPKRVGTDGSDQYTKNKKVAFYYYHPNSRRVVTFKPFLTSLSYKMQYSEGEVILERADGYLKKDTLKRGINYSIGLALPAHSVNEAILNLSKMNELKAFHFSNYAPGDDILGPDDKRDPIDQYLLNTKMIFMSNIVSNGKYVKGTDISSHKKILKYGVPGIIKDLKIDFDKTLGFFEHGGKLYPKLINLSFDLDVLNEQVYKINKKRLFLPFEKNGSYKKDDVKYWPFGITGFSSSDKVSDGDGKRKHANLKNLWFSLASEEVAGTYVLFPLMMESISLTVKNEFSEEKDLSHGALFDRKFKAAPVNKLDISVSINTAAATVNEARNFMYQIQKMIRLVNLNPDDYKINTYKAATAMTPNAAEKAYADPKFKKHLERDSSKKIIQWSDLNDKQKTAWKNKATATMGSSSYTKGEWQSSGGDMKLNHLHVTNLIGKDKISGRPNKGEIISKGHVVKVKSFSFEPDLSLGFFDEDNFLYFKSMKLSFDFELVNDQGILQTTYGHVKNSEKKITIKRGSGSAIDVSSVKTYDKII